MHSPVAVPVPRRVGLVLGLASVLAACGLLGGANTVVLPAIPGLAPELPVELTRRSADVIGLEVPSAAVQAAFGIDEGATPLPERPSAVLVRWVGGACDQRADIGVGRDPTGAVIIAVRSWSTDQPCDGVGVPRAVIVTFAAPVQEPIGMQHQPCRLGGQDCQ
jgi:hypothetical protein